MIFDSGNGSTWGGGEFLPLWHFEIADIAWTTLRLHSRLHTEYHSHTAILFSTHYQDRVVGIATGYGPVDWGGRSLSPGRFKNFLLSTSARLALASTQPPIQWVPEVKRPGREADHSTPSSALFKKMRIYTSTPPYAFTVKCLIKHRDNFTLHITKTFFSFLGPILILSFYFCLYFRSCNSPAVFHITALYGILLHEASWLKW
jgi:hypothetical protein